MNPQSAGGFRKVLLMALLGLVVIIFAAPIAIVLGLALVGYMVYGLYGLVVRGGPVTFRNVTEGAADFCGKLLNAGSWIGDRVVGAFALVAGLAARMVRGIFGLGTRALRLALSSAFGGLLGAAVWSLFSFDPATLVAGGVFGAIVGIVAGLDVGRSKKGVGEQPAASRA